MLKTTLRHMSRTREEPPGGAHGPAGSTTRGVCRASLLMVVLLASLALLVGCRSTVELEPGPGVVGVDDDEPTVTTVYVVRHAEKEDDSEDPSLSARGQKRAAALAGMLGDDDIAAVFATQYKRTVETVAPLAAALDKQVERVDAGDVEGLAGRLLRDYPGGAVVVAGHSNTVPALLQALGVTEEVTLNDADYGDLFVVTVYAGEGLLDTGHRVEFSRHRFGD